MNIIYLNCGQAYDRFIRKDGQFAGENGFSILLGLFTRLRQICIAPYLITNESKRKQEFESTNLKENNARFRRIGS